MCEAVGPLDAVLASRKTPEEFVAWAWFASPAGTPGSPVRETFTQPGSVRCW